MNLERLNEEFSIAGHLTFIEGPGGLPQALINNSLATATVSVYAGQVLAFKPKTTEQDLFFVSELAHYQDGKAIKGGIPLCWPWFGDDPEQRGRASHGFVRNRMWRVNSSQVLDDGRTELILGLSSSKQTQEIWPHRFELRLEVIVGHEMEVNLVTVNKDDHDISISQALHTYFLVGDVTSVQVHGLEDRRYLDKLDGFTEKKQSGAITVNAGVDRIYLDTATPLVIEDGSLDRQIQISSAGSQSAVVWNPWIENAAQMADFKDDDYLRMICVETTNAGPDRVTVKPAESYRLGAVFKVD